MNLPRASVKYPVTTTVGVILAVLFGAISLYRIPVQMTPTVDRPVITVETEYKGAAPLEVEEEVSKPVEEKLTSVEGLNRMTSRSEEGKSRVVLEFDWDVDKDVARLDVSEKLGLVRNLPDDSDRSTISALNSDSQNPIAWVIVETKLPINDVRVEGDAVIRPKLERVEGVGQVWMFGGQDREVRVTLDYAAMSARGITVTALREALRRENKNTKAGRIDEGKRRYAVRTVGNFTRLDQVRNTIIAQNGSGAVYLRDVAKVSFDYGDPERRIRIRQVPTMGFGVLRKTGANTIEVMAGVKKAIAEVNEIYAGRGIRLRQVYDETDYIHQSRSLVINNIFVGGALAIGVLLLFLGSLSSVMVIGVAIPVTVVSTFILIFVLGRSINIISLAGMAFAVGMVVDNSVVVLENIFRHREMGKTKWNAAIDGAQEVWGAVLASTLTTLAVFIPVVFVQDESGQLFRDIAIAISVAVALSLVVSISVVPMLSSRILSDAGTTSPLARLFRLLGVYAFGRFCRRIYVGTLGWLLKGVMRRLFVATLITAGAIVLAVQFFPSHRLSAQGQPQPPVRVSAYASGPEPRRDGQNRAEPRGAARARRGGRPLFRRGARAKSHHRHDREKRTFRSRLHAAPRGQIVRNPPGNARGARVRHPGVVVQAARFGLHRRDQPTGRHHRKQPERDSAHRRRRERPRARARGRALRELEFRPRKPRTSGARG